MAYTTNELISGAFYASGVVSREFETVSGGQVSDGLLWLNDILAEKSVSIGLIPYESTYTFNSIVGQTSYYIQGLELIDTLVFFKNNVRYSLTYDKRNNFFGSPRTENITSLPYEWYFERAFGGGNLHIYFAPDEAYQFEARGVFRFGDVALGQDLSLDTTVANLGIATVTGTGEIGAGQLVVNDIDLAGTYATPTALMTYVNTGVITGVTASLSGNEFILTSAVSPQPLAISIVTLGTEDAINNITFADFSLVNGAYSKSYRPQGLEKFYITYLRYALADRICAEYNFDTPQNVRKQLSKYESFIDKKSRPLDLRMEKVSTLQRGGAINYAQVNIGKGWTV